MLSKVTPIIYHLYWHEFDISPSSLNNAVWTFVPCSVKRSFAVKAPFVDSGSPFDTVVPKGKRAVGVGNFY